ncbi:MAG: hypothetical protein ACREDA_07845, partial [Methylocella sp.]
VSSLARYAREQRERYFAAGKPLDGSNRTAMRPFFSAALLSRVRIIEMAGRQIEEPPFYPEARARGVHLPQVNHMSSITFVDAVVFTEGVKTRDLFHALVHATQFEIFGLAGYIDLYVRAFFKVNRTILVPLEAHAFELDTRFFADSTDIFSVEGEVWRWIKEGRYGLRSHANIVPPS